MPHDEEETVKAATRCLTPTKSLDRGSLGQRLAKTVQRKKDGVIVVSRKIFFEFATA